MGLRTEQHLLAELWLDELQKLRETCSRGSGEDGERAVRRAFHLRTLSPKPLQRILPLDVAEDELEELLDQGDIEAAARALVGRDWTILISPSPIKGRVVAKLTGRRNQVLEAAGSCPAMAMIGAWVQLLTGAPSDAMEPARKTGRPTANGGPGKTLLHTA